MGRPPLAYLTECRMDEAEALLSDTDLGIAQIARFVGYADAFGFSAAFKRLKGLSPSAYRAAAAAGSDSLASRQPAARQARNTIAAGAPRVPASGG
jgi:AraC-like DNA-binding protein